MNIKDVFDKVISVLPEDIKNNYSLKSLFKAFLSNINKYKDATISIRESLYNQFEEFSKCKSIISMEEEDTKIFYFSSYDEYGSVIFYLDENMQDKAYLKINNYSENININYEVTLCLGDNNIWKLVSYLTDNQYYFLDYNIEMYSYNKDNKLIEKDFEKEKDEEFANTFGIDKKEANYYRLNFRDNAYKLNKRFIESEMESLDKTYTCTSYMFAPPFKMNDFREYILDTTLEELEEDNVESEEIDTQSIEYKRIDKIYKLINKNINNKGEFVMTYNLFWNLLTYLNEEIEVLDTTGVIIRKYREEYTLYYVYINTEMVTIIPKSISMEEANNLYLSDENNSITYGVKDFFSKGKGYTL